MKLHGPLATERVAVRQSSNAGKGFRETHGLHGNMDKLLYAAVKWGHQALLTGIQKVSEKIRASVRFPANLCPACISGERHAVRRGALPCDVSRRATVRACHHCPIGNCKISSRPATWATSACSTRSPNGTQTHNLMNPYRKVNHGPKARFSLIGDLFSGISQQCTKEIESR